MGRHAAWALLPLLAATSCLIPIDDVEDEAEKTGGAGGSTTGGKGGNGGTSTGGVANGGTGGVTTGGTGGAAGGSGSGGAVGGGGTIGGGTGGANIGGGGTTVGGAGGGVTTDCPQIAGTSPMIGITALTGANYCIDQHEVTVSEYQAFLATVPVISVAGCEANTTLTPTCTQTPATGGNKPVACVDWCDAAAYCAYVGKRLCGKIGGGNVAISDTANPNVSQWFAACSANGKFVYPYGPVFDQKACNGAESGYVGTQNVTSIATCMGAYPGLYDMSGNVSEWEESCSTSGECMVRGGDYLSLDKAMSCPAAVPYDRLSSDARRGFRCCT